MANHKGYWFRKGRGWCLTDGKSQIPLCDEHGMHLRDPKARTAARDAFRRYLVRLTESHDRSGATVKQVADTYLSWCRDHHRPKTYAIRSYFLNAFAKYYSKRPIVTLTPLDLDQWFGRHLAWGSTTQSIAITSVKRALNFAVSRGIVTSNPLSGYKTAKHRKRITYFTPEQEAAMFRHANPALALALKVLIRTGVRPGCEFAVLTAPHVEETAKGLVWRFAENESKNHRQRIVYVPKEIADIVRERIQQYPAGPLFRNTWGTPWAEDSLTQTLHRLKQKLQKEGVVLDEAACPYTCRHTYAKRTLGGYWTGRPCIIEQLCGLMGNSRDVCWQHYAQWCHAYTDPLWGAVE